MVGVLLQPGHEHGVDRIHHAPFPPALQGNNGWHRVVTKHVQQQFRDLGIFAPFGLQILAIHLIVDLTLFVFPLLSG